ncbi:MAG: circularly permuted type 2 ATP-grasp protein [bacterium]|nr:circularly permuted type 2 ATP-grasp protein [bacterium]
MNEPIFKEEAQPNAPPVSFADLLEQYRPGFDHYDEAVDSAGHVRSSWSRLFQRLSGMSLPEFERRILQAQKQLELDGVAFNPHDSTRGVSRPWRLDPIPLVLDAQEWQKIERGMDQRAQLADLVLLDLLGPQTLLRERVLPPEILFADPRYLPACHAAVPHPKKHLHLYAADLARSFDGQWWITAERTRSPFGLGYLLENRLVTSRMLPEAFQHCNAVRLASFFITLRQTLKGLAKRYRENPRIAIWSKGPGSRAYFEDSFLARYLGYTLVEGEDLAVRDQRVMLKTLGGLLPVEVLLRRVEDQECDPVELLGGDRQGIAGLMEVVRSGDVTVSNSIGSALAEAPLLLAFLPSVCQHFFGQDLIVPSVATWWCGQEAELQYVLEHMDELLIRNAFRSDDEPPYRPSEMTQAEKQKLVARIREQPHRFVGQERMVRSTTPVYEDGRLQTWSLALRAYAVAKNNSYQILPGALARVSPDPEVLSHNMTSGEKSQDVWIVSDQSVPHVSLLENSVQETELKRAGAELPSRVADNLFWLGRNLERSEQIARLVRLVLQELTGEAAASAGTHGLLKACRRAKLLDKPEKLDDEYLLAQEITRGALDRKVAHSLRGVVMVSHATAAKVRDRLAIDCFRVITELRDLLGSVNSDARIAPTDFMTVLDEAITLTNAISGFASESMTRTLGWRFLDLGRRIERAYQTSQLLLSLLPMEDEKFELNNSLENCLQVCDSFMTYRGRYLANIQLAAVLDLLITDETNPRSIAFQLQAITQHVDRLPRPDTQASISPEQRIALSLSNSVRLADVVELGVKVREGDWSNLQKLLRRLVEQLPKLSDAISGKFLIHAGLQRHFARS